MGRILLAESSAAAGVTIDKCSMLMDVKGVSMSMFTKYVREVFGALSKIDSDNYPETLGLIFVVNAGVVFRTIWKASPLIPSLPRGAAPGGHSPLPRDH